MQAERKTPDQSGLNRRGKYRETFEQNKNCHPERSAESKSPS
jgi:hypothetical protein